MSAVVPYKLASVLLQYPTQALFAALDPLDAAAAGSSPGASRRAFARFLDWLRATPPTEVAQHYVETFDLYSSREPARSAPGSAGNRGDRRRCTLYLTYPRYGDTRKRGMALLTFKAAYRAAGVEPTGTELPDYLPLVLDFAALSPRGEALLRAHRADLELLRRALHGTGTPYAHLLDGVCAGLPGLGRRDLALVRRSSRDGPPREEVGLEPFAPPEYLTGARTGERR